MKRTTPRKCESTDDAIAILDGVKDSIADSEAVKQIEAVQKWISELHAPIIHKNIRGKEYFANPK